MLKPEIEAQLEKDMLKWWRGGYLAKDIADKLDFGKPGVYEKLKTFHVYFYRSKFGFPRRQRPPRGKGQSRYKHKPKELGVMSPDVFVEMLNAKVPKNPSFHRCRKRTYLILHYWTPLRKSEIYERVIDDFEITNSKLIIHLLRKKKDHKPSDDDEPVSVPLAFPLMGEVIEWLEGRLWNTKSNKNHIPWRIGKDTARNYVKEVFEDYYPHFFRFNWVSDATSDPETSIRELVAKTHLTLPALMKYIVTDEKSEAAIDQRKLQRLQKQGVLKNAGA